MEERLHRLRSLLVEFYEGTGPKVQLNEELGLLRTQSWRDALYWIESSPDFGGGDSSALYMSYFCASALEESLRVDFGRDESASARNEIRLALFAPREGRGALVACAQGSRPPLPGAVRTRLCKVFVDVGKAGWPHEIPTFLEDICAAAMAQDEPTSALGLELVSLTAEEFLCAGANRGTTATRRRELKALLSSHLPQLVALLGEALARRASIQPSPGGISATASSALAENYALNCLRTVVSNAPLQHQHLRPELFETLFRLVERDMSSPSASKATAIGALGALDSVLAKRLVPPDMANFVQELCGHVLKMLRTLTDLLDAQPSDAVEDQEAQDFLAQVCELVATFVEQHLPRVVDPTELLTLLAKLTFSRAVNEAGSLRRILRPWATLVDFAEDAPPGVASATGEGVAGVLCSLLETRVLFSTNARALEYLDEEEDESAYEERKALDDDLDDLVDLDELIDEMAGGEPDPRALGGGRGNANTNELSALLSEAIDLFAAASRGVYGPYCSSRLASAATSHLESALNRAFSPSNSDADAESHRRAATDATTLLYALSASAPYSGGGGGAGADDMQRAGRAAVATALGVLGQRAHGRAFVNLAVASLDALRDLTPAIAYRGDGDEVVEGSLDAASMSLDVSISPYPEPVQRAGAWLVLAVAKSSADKNETSLRKLSSLAGSGAWIATANAPPRCRSLVYRAAAAVSLAMAARQNRVAYDAINALVQPLAEPLSAAAQRISTVNNNLVGLEELLDVGALDTCQRAARSLAALCAGFARDGAARGAVSKAFFGADNNNATSVALASAPALLAYCAARALRSVDGSSQPRVVRSISSARIPHLACATGAVDLLIAASRAFGKDRAGGRALEGVSALLAAFEVAPPAIAFEQVRRGGSVLGSRPPRAAALHLVKAACRLVTVVTADNDAKKAVPDACSLATHHVAPLAGDVNVAPDLFPILLEVCRRLLVDQWAAFVVSANDGGRATATKRFRDDRAAANFDSLLDLVLAGCRGVDLTSFCVRRALLVLKDSNAAHRLYDFPPFALKWRAPLAHALFDALLERRHDSIADDLIQTLLDLAKPNHHQLFANFLPNKLASINMTDQQRSYILDNLLRDNDAAAFPAKLQDTITDLHHFRALLEAT